MVGWKERTKKRRIIVIIIILQPLCVIYKKKIRSRFEGHRYNLPSLLLTYFHMQQSRQLAMFIIIYFQILLVQATLPFLLIYFRIQQSSSSLQATCLIIMTSERARAALPDHLSRRQFPCLPVAPIELHPPAAGTDVYYFLYHII